MIHKLQKITAALALILGLGLPLFAPVMVRADSLADACEGLALADPTATCDSAQAKTSFGSIIRNVINVLSIIVGAVAVIMIIIGGFRYVISNGDTSGLTGAKNTILYAIVGLVIVIFAQVIVRFVLTNVTGGTTGTSTPPTSTAPPAPTTGP